MSDQIQFKLYLQSKDCSVKEYECKDSECNSDNGYLDLVKAGTIYKLENGRSHLEDLIITEKTRHVFIPYGGSPLYYTKAISKNETERWAASCKTADFNVVPLNKLHEMLIDPKLNQEEAPEAVSEKAAFNIAFYGSWFPKEVGKQFDLAQALLVQNGKEAGPLLMALEAVFAPNLDRFMQWITKRQSKWNSRFGNESTLMTNLGIAKLWHEDLPGPQKKIVERLFYQTHQLCKARNYDLGGQYVPFKKMMLELHVLSMAGKEKEEKKPEDVLTDELFSLNPATILKTIDKENVTYEPLPKDLADRVWTFFVNNHSTLGSLDDYWNTMESFLFKNKQYIKPFLERVHTWNSSTTNGTVYNLNSIYSRLLTQDLVPDNKKRILYFELLAAKDQMINHLELASIQDIDTLEKRLVLYFLKQKIQTEDRYALGHFEDVCEHLIVTLTKKWGSKRFIAFLKQNLPSKAIEQMEISFNLIGLMGDQDPNAVKLLLGQYQDSSTIKGDNVRNDPLWEIIWGAFGGGLLSGVFEGASQWKRYNRAVKKVPNMLIDAGKNDMVRRFYFNNHPYAPIYKLPASLRPTGKGLSFVSIDSFYNPHEEKHPDKTNVKTVPFDKMHWAKADGMSHGVGVTSMAVGESLGLAPATSLYVVPVNASIKENFPTSIMEALKKIVELKKKDPSVTVVGISLGLGIPVAFRNQVRKSAIFQQMVGYCNELHDMGVAVVISAGNDGEKDHINMLGLLPHVTLVGALDSNKTADRSDDTVSEYTTGGDSVNKPDLGAHADPVLFPYNKEDETWLSQGGTSSAQPHYSGTLLMMKSANPSLSIDDCNTILRLTADKLKGDKETMSIDPMKALLATAHLPGSTYQKSQLGSLANALGFKTVNFALLQQFLEIEKALTD